MIELVLVLLSCAAKWRRQLQRGNRDCRARRSVTMTCADCGSTQSVPRLPRRGRAECHRCGRLLARRTSTGADLTLACAIAIFILLPPAVFMPLLDSTIRNL